MKGLWITLYFDWTKWQLCPPTIKAIRHSNTTPLVVIRHGHQTKKRTVGAWKCMKGHLAWIISFGEMFCCNQLNELQMAAYDVLTQTVNCISLTFTHHPTHIYNVATSISIFIMLGVFLTSQSKMYILRTKCFIYNSAHVSHTSSASLTVVNSAISYQLHPLRRRDFPATETFCNNAFATYIKHGWKNDMVAFSRNTTAFYVNQREHKLNSNVANIQWNTKARSEC